MPEGDADAGTGVGDLEHGVLPCPLRVAAGDEEVTVAEREGARGSAATGAEEEATWLAEGDQRDDGPVDARGNLVPVPGDAVPAVPVEVEAGGVERTP